MGVKTVCLQGKEPLVQLGNLQITPWHPVLQNGHWVFPADIAPAAECPCPAVYNFVLEHTHVISIDGVGTVTLGHNLQHDVVRHPYFGTSAVIDDIMRMPGYGEGRVMLHSGCLKRSHQTGLVNGLSYFTKQS